MDTKQVIRMLTYGYLNFVPMALSCWVTTIIPEIMTRNFKISDPEMVSRNIGYFYSSYYWGILVSAFIWPSAVFYISKRNAMLLGLILMTCSNYFVGKTINISYICFFKFLTGFSYNVGSIGKDFLFYFTKPKYRQYIFNVSTSFVMIGVFLTPFIGSWLYNWCEKDFETANDYITLLCVFEVLLFVVVFYLFYTPGDIADGTIGDDEEKARLKEDFDDDPKQQKGIMHVLQISVKDSNIRNLLIVYVLTNGVFNVCTNLMVLYLETPWNENGFGLSSEIVSKINIFVFLPVTFLILFSPIFVPSKIQGKTFINFFIWLLLLSIFSFPVLRDLIPDKNHQKYAFLPLTQLFLMYISIPKVYSPILNFNLCVSVDKYCRTSVNSINLILSSFASASFTVSIFPIFGWALFNPAVRSNIRLTHYIPFLLLVFLLIGALFSLRKLK